MINASDAKREFGELLLKTQHAPVGINKNGKPVAVVVSIKEYEHLADIIDSTLEQWGVEKAHAILLQTIKQGCYYSCSTSEHGA